MNFLEQILSIVKSVANAELDLCVVNTELCKLTDIETMGYEEFSLRTIKVMPDKLYKFFSNSWETEKGCKKPINYSHQALKNNTVYLQNPELFDDVYDSDLHIKWVDYQKLKLQKYCQGCNINYTDASTCEQMISAIALVFSKATKTRKSLLEVFVSIPKDANEQRRFEFFTLSVENEILRTGKTEVSTKQYKSAIENALQKEYEIHTYNLRTTFRTSCFTTSPYSQLMWGGHYADKHSGFCVEYSIDKIDTKYSELLHNLFPVIYCKSRPNMTNRLTNIWDGDFTMEKMWDIYFHGALRKGVEWVQQNEWRLILPLSKDTADFNVPFFPITKVFLGNRMANKDKADIIEICKQRKIPYIGVTRSKDVFEMRDCDILCEKCPSFLQQKTGSKKGERKVQRKKPS